MLRPALKFSSPSARTKRAAAWLWAAIGLRHRRPCVLAHPTHVLEESSLRILARSGMGVGFVEGVEEMLVRESEGLGTWRARAEAAIVLGRTKNLKDSDSSDSTTVKKHYPEHKQTCCKTFSQVIYILRSE